LDSVKGMCRKAKTPEDVVDEAITKQIKHDKKRNQIKLLLLGAGESGKSTIAKQLKAIYKNGYEDPEECIRFKGIVYRNIIDNMRAILEAMEKMSISFKNPQNQELAVQIFRIDEDEIQKMEKQGLSDGMVHCVKSLWEDAGVQAAYARSSEYQINDTAAYFFDKLETFAPASYVPDLDDIVHVRSKTTGINEIDFTIGTYNFGVTDVGGQRSERRKWIHCFQDVTAIIFCAALSEYDQKLLEDSNVNRMSESLKLFKDISSLSWFQDTPIILFLNKLDLFEEKIQKIPLTVYFTDYAGPQTAEDGAKYIQQQFLAQVVNKKSVYVYKSVATSTDNIQFLFKAAKDIMINAFLTQLGMNMTGTV